MNCRLGYGPADSMMMRTFNASSSQNIGGGFFKMRQSIPAEMHKGQMEDNNSNMLSVSERKPRLHMTSSVSRFNDYGGGGSVMGGETSRMYLRVQKEQELEAQIESKVQTIEARMKEHTQQKQRNMKMKSEGLKHKNEETM